MADADVDVAHNIEAVDVFRLHQRLIPLHIDNNIVFGEFRQIRSPGNTLGPRSEGYVTCHTAESSSLHNALDTIVINGYDDLCGQLSVAGWDKDRSFNGWRKVYRLD